MNLDWIDKLIKGFPEISPCRKNLIEIAAYPKWENVNSNRGANRVIAPKSKASLAFSK